VRTLIVSDLHLGARRGQDSLRQPRARARLLNALKEFDRLVLLGDVLELRNGPLRSVLGAAAPVLSDIARVLGADREVVVVPGNHDHALLRGWLERRGRDREPPPLGLESPVEWDPRETLGAVAQHLAPTRLRVAYPGVWLRGDVYATHGHYCDRHDTVPLIERVAAGFAARVVGEPPGGPTRAEDYEAAFAPAYAWIEAVAQSDRFKRRRSDGGLQVRTWQTLTRANGRRTLRGTAAAVAFRVAIAGLNRAGMGPLGADVSAEELHRGALRAFEQVLLRLGVSASYVIFGHTHRAGPVSADDGREWRTPAGAQMLNTGSWVYEPHFLEASARDNPYRPGFAAVIGDDGPPVVVNLLD
jgi:3',5'-cyclic AMP phosphodiesterase CpdA